MFLVYRLAAAVFRIRKEDTAVMGAWCLFAVLLPGRFYFRDSVSGELDRESERPEPIPDIQFSRRIRQVFQLRHVVRCVIGINSDRWRCFDAALY